MDENYLIKKWLSNTLTEEEWKEFKNLEDYNLLMGLTERAKNFKANQFLDAPDFGLVKDKIDSRNKKSNFFKSYKVLLRFAAVFILGIGVYLTFFTGAMTKIETFTGEKKTVMLPDASEIIMNAVSEIEYNEKRWDTKRELKLSGEAYFKVAKGSTFDVLTDAGTVAVLGTQFNVKIREKYFEVFCNEGSVGVTYKGKLSKLLPGQFFRVVKDKVVQDTIQNTQPLWITNMSSFDNVPFYEVIQELERQYGVKVDASSVDVEHLFKGGFVHGDLNQALDLITLPLGLTYDIQSPKLVVLKNSE